MSHELSSLGLNGGREVYLVDGSNVARAPSVRRSSGGRSRWRTCSGSAARATGARLGWTVGWRGSCQRARRTGGEPVRSCGSIARGPVRFLPRSASLTPASAGSCSRTSAPRHDGVRVGQKHLLAAQRDGRDCVFRDSQVSLGGR